MQLYHERDKYIAHKDFFTTRMKELSRRTSKMILGMLGMLPYDGYYVHKNMTTILNLDWDDTTHQVHANTVIDPETGRTRVRLTITVTGFNITPQHVCALRCSQPWTPFLRVHPRKLGHQAIRWKRREVDQ